jgi:3-oxoacyl-[acyl-carrier protein] reductase
MDLGLKGKVALVTGASRGIGRAIAFALAAEGTTLALCSRTEKEIKETAEEIDSLYGVKVHAEAMDLLKPEAIQAFVEGSLKALGRIDVLVNNVGAGLTRPFEELTEKDWHETVERNFWIAVRCCQAVLSMMKAHGGGRIINIAALSGKVPRRGQIGSNVAKAALINLTESLACEVGSYGIRVNAVCPAAILTERWEARVRGIAVERGEQYDETLRQLARTKIPAGRFGTPDDVAALVVFLASDKSDFINGVSIEVDGGLGRCLAVEIK